MLRDYIQQPVDSWQSKRNDVVANNIANVNTAGFKRKKL